MRYTAVCRVAIAMAAMAAAAACADTTPMSLDGSGNAPVFQSFGHSEWSTPVMLPAPVNLSTSNEQGPAISADGLSLYFCSNRAPSLGNDIWVSRRASEDDAWGEPVNVAILNSPVGDCGPSLSVDGRMLFITSARAGGAGGNDIYLATREDPSDDLAWSVPARLGAEINTPAFEFSPFVTRYHDAECDETGCMDAWAELYFERGPSNVANDIYVVRIDRQGAALGAAVLVDGINSSASDLHPTIRFDGREMIFSSNRDGRGGNQDIFVSRRQSPNHPWSTPEPIDELNVSNRHEIHVTLSRDGRTLYFIRGTGQANDIWMSTRTPSGR